MFVRLRWFLYGFVSSIGVIAYLSVQVKRAKERLTPAALVRSGGQTVASLLDRTAARVAPTTGPPPSTAHPITPTEGAPDPGDDGGTGPVGPATH